MMNDGHDWMLPRTLRLADIGLGHDERAQESQPAREKLGPRFLDWQLAQTVEESWVECELHARNLLGQAGYDNLFADLSGAPGTAHTVVTTQPPPVKHNNKFGLVRPYYDLLQSLTFLAKNIYRKK
jgi:hypothetical protein